CGSMPTDVGQPRRLRTRSQRVQPTGSRPISRDSTLGASLGPPVAKVREVTSTFAHRYWHGPAVGLTVTQVWARICRACVPFIREAGPVYVQAPKRRSR